MGKKFNTAGLCLKCRHYMVVIANRIFETLMYNIFISSDETSSEMYKVGSREKNQ